MPDIVIWFTLLFYRICCLFIYILESIKNFIIKILNGHHTGTIWNVPGLKINDETDKCQDYGSSLGMKRSKLRYRTRIGRQSKTSSNRKRNFSNFSKGIRFHNSELQCDFEKAQKVTVSFEFALDNNTAGETSPIISGRVPFLKSGVTKSESVKPHGEYNQFDKDAVTFISAQTLLIDDQEKEILTSTNPRNSSLKINQASAPEVSTTQVQDRDNISLHNISHSSKQEKASNNFQGSFSEFNEASVNNRTAETESKNELESKNLASNNSQHFTYEVSQTVASNISTEVLLTQGQDTYDTSLKSLPLSSEEETDICASNYLQSSFFEFNEAAANDMTAETASKDEQEKEKLSSNNSQHFTYEINQKVASDISTDVVLTQGQDTDDASLKSLPHSSKEQKDIHASNNLQGSFFEFNEADFIDMTTEATSNVQEKENIASNDSQQFTCEINPTFASNMPTEVLLTQGQDPDGTLLKSVPHSFKEEKGIYASNKLQGSFIEFNEAAVNDGYLTTETITKDGQEKDKFASNRSQHFTCDINQIAASDISTEELLTQGQYIDGVSLNDLPYSFKQEKSIYASNNQHGAYSELNEAAVNGMTPENISKVEQEKENLASNNSQHITYEMNQIATSDVSTEVLLTQGKYANTLLNNFPRSSKEDKCVHESKKLHGLSSELNENAISDKNNKSISKDIQERENLALNNLQHFTYEINQTDSDYKYFETISKDKIYNESSSLNQLQLSECDESFKTKLKQEKEIVESYDFKNSSFERCKTAGYNSIERTLRDKREKGTFEIADLEISSCQFYQTISDEMTETILEDKWETANFKENIGKCLCISEMDVLKSKEKSKLFGIHECQKSLDIKLKDKNIVSGNDEHVNTFKKFKTSNDEIEQLQSMNLPINNELNEPGYHIASANNVKDKSILETERILVSHKACTNDGVPEKNISNQHYSDNEQKYDSLTELENYSSESTLQTAHFVYYVPTALINVSNEQNQNKEKIEETNNLKNVTSTSEELSRFSVLGKDFVEKASCNEYQELLIKKDESKANTDKQSILKEEIFKMSSEVSKQTSKTKLKPISQFKADKNTLNRKLNKGNIEIKMNVLRNNPSVTEHLKLAAEEESIIENSKEYHRRIGEKTKIGFNAVNEEVAEKKSFTLTKGKAVLKQDKKSPKFHNIEFTKLMSLHENGRPKQTKSPIKRNHCRSSSLGNYEKSSTDTTASTDVAQSETKLFVKNQNYQNEPENMSKCDSNVLNKHYDQNFGFGTQDNTEEELDQTNAETEQPQIAHFSVENTSNHLESSMTINNKDQILVSEFEKDEYIPKISDKMVYFKIYTNDKEIEKIIVMKEYGTKRMYSEICRKQFLSHVISPESQDQMQNFNMLPKVVVKTDQYVAHLENNGAEKENLQCGGKSSFKVLSKVPLENQNKPLNKDVPPVVSNDGEQSFVQILNNETKRQVSSPKKVNVQCKNLAVICNQLQCLENLEENDSDIVHSVKLQKKIQDIELDCTLEDENLKSKILIEIGKRNRMESNWKVEKDGLQVETVPQNYNNVNKETVYDRDSMQQIALPENTAQFKVISEAGSSVESNVMSEADSRVESNLKSETDISFQLKVLTKPDINVQTAVFPESDVNLQLEALTEPDINVQTDVFPESDAGAQSNFLSEFDSAQPEGLMASDVGAKVEALSIENIVHPKVLSKSDVSIPTKVFPKSKVIAQSKTSSDIQVVQPKRLTLADVTAYQKVLSRSNLADQPTILSESNFRDHPTTLSEPYINEALEDMSKSYVECQMNVLSVQKVSNQMEVFTESDGFMESDVSVKMDTYPNSNVIAHSKILTEVTGIQPEGMTALDVDYHPEFLFKPQIREHPEVFKKSDVSAQRKSLPESDVSTLYKFLPEANVNAQTERLILSNANAQGKVFNESNFGDQSTVLCKAYLDDQLEIMPEVMFQPKILSKGQVNARMELLAKKDINSQQAVFTESNVFFKSDATDQPKSSLEIASCHLEGLTISDDSVQPEVLTVAQFCDNSNVSQKTIISFQSKVSPESDNSARSKILHEDHVDIQPANLTFSASSQQKVLSESDLRDQPTVLSKVYCPDHPKLLSDSYATDHQEIFSREKVKASTKFLKESDADAKTEFFTEAEDRAQLEYLQDRSRSVLQAIQLVDSKILQQKIIDRQPQSLFLSEEESKATKAVIIPEKEHDSMHSVNPLKDGILMLASMLSENCNSLRSKILQKEDNVEQSRNLSEINNFEVTKLLPEESDNKSKILDFLEILKQESNEVSNSEITDNNELHLFRNTSMCSSVPEKNDSEESQFLSQTDMNSKSEILNETTYTTQQHAFVGKDDLVQSKLSQIKGDSAQSYILPEKNDSIKSSILKNKVKLLKIDIQPIKHTDLSLYERNISLFREVYSKTNNLQFSEKESMHSKISQNDESLKEIFDMTSKENDLNFKYKEIPENTKTSLSASVYENQNNTLCFNKAPSLFIDTHLSPENLELYFTYRPKLPNFDFNTEYPVHRLNKNDFKLYNYFTNYQISEDEILQSPEYLKINDSQIRSGYNPMLCLPVYWDKMCTDRDRVIVKKCKIKCFIRNTDDSETKKDASEIVLSKNRKNSERRIIDAHDPKTNSINSHDNKKQIQNLGAREKDTSNISRGVSDLDVITGANPSDSKVQTLFTFDDSFKETKDQNLETLSQINIEELFQPLQTLDSSKQSSFQNDHKLFPLFPECICENVIKSQGGESKTFKKNVSSETKSVKRKQATCSANKIKTSLTRPNSEKNIIPGYPAPELLVSFRKEDINNFTDKQSNLKKFETDEDYLQIKWNESDKMFYRYVMKSELDENDLTIAEYRSRLSLEESMCNRLTSAPVICDGMTASKNEFSLGKRIIKCLNENVMSSNSEEKSNEKKISDVFHGTVTRKLKVLKVPTNSPPKRRKNLSSAKESSTVNSKVKASKTMFDSKTCDFTINEKLATSIQETNNIQLTKDKSDRNSKEIMQIKNKESVLKTGYNSKECNAKNNKISDSTQKITSTEYEHKYKLKEASSAEHMVSTLKTDNYGKSNKYTTTIIPTSVQVLNDNPSSTDDKSHTEETKKMECIVSALGTEEHSVEYDQKKSNETPVSVQEMGDSLSSTESESEYDPKNTM